MKKNRLKNFLITPFTLAMILAGSQTLLAFSLNVDPPTVKISGQAGGSTTGSITTHNRGQTSLLVKVYVEDWEYAKNGADKNFKPVGTTAYSSGDWVNVYPSEYEIAPGEKKEIQFTFVLPEEAQGGYCGVIFFETNLGDGQTEEGVAVTFAGRIGVITYLEVEGRTIRDGRVYELSATPPTESEPLQLQMGFENTGNTFILAKGVINIIDSEGNIYLNEKIDYINTLPGDKVEKTISWAGILEAGVYDIILTLELGDGNIIVKESKLTVPG